MLALRVVAQNPEPKGENVIDNKDVSSASYSKPYGRCLEGPAAAVCLRKRAPHCDFL